MSISEGRVATLRPMVDSDIEIVVELHRSCLHPGFFVRLGRRFLSRYYETFVASPDSVALVAVKGDRVAGFLVGTIDNGAHYRWVVDNRRARLARAGAVGLSAHPGLALQFVRTRLAGYCKSLAHFSRRGPVGSGRPAATLTHIAVVPDARGIGVGQQLVDGYLGRVRDNGAVDKVGLVTRSDRSGACEFYSRLGWTKCGDSTDMDGNRYCRLELTLD